MKRLASFVLLLPFLSACGATRVPAVHPQAPQEWVERGCAYRELPELSGNAPIAWRRMRDSQLEPFSIDFVAAEDWYAELVSQARALFQTSEPESMEWLEENTRLRREFIELWMRRDTPIVVVVNGSFKIAGSVGETLAASAFAAADDELARVWIRRSSGTSSECR